MVKLLSGFILAVALSIAAFDKISERKVFKRILVAPPNDIKYFTLGMSNALADLLWLRVIQDMDYCGGVNITEVNWEGKEDQKPKCNNGWVAKMFDLITDLSPDFYLVYRVGITALPIIVGDDDGGERIVEKATKKYPKDWTIAYRSAYFYIFEKPNKARAAQLLTVAGQNGAPEWVLSLAARLYDESGELLLGMSVLEETIKSTKEESFKKELQKKLAALKAKYEKLNK
jgi:hypothetical protein